MTIPGKLCFIASIGAAWLITWHQVPLEQKSWNVPKTSDGFGSTSALIHAEENSWWVQGCAETNYPQLLFW